MLLSPVDAIASSPAKARVEATSTVDSSHHISSSRQSATANTPQAGHFTSLKLKLNTPAAPRSANAPVTAVAPAPAPSVAATRAPAPAAPAEVLDLLDASLSPPRPPRPKARRLKAPASPKATNLLTEPVPLAAPKKRTSDAAQLGSEDELDLLGPARANPAPGPSDSPAQSTSLVRTVPSSPLSTAHELSPVTSKKAAAARRARAVSGDGELGDVLRQVAEAMAKASEDDSDFGMVTEKWASAKGKGKWKGKGGKKAKTGPQKAAKGKAEPEPAGGAEADQMEMDEGFAVASPVTKCARNKSDRRLVLESDQGEGEDGGRAGAAEASPSKATPVAMKPTDPTNKTRASASKPSFTLEVPVSAKRPTPTRPIPLAKRSGRKTAVMADSEEDPAARAFDSDAESAILTNDEESDAPLLRKKQAKGEALAKRSPVAKRKAPSPVASRTLAARRAGRPTVEEQEAITRAATEEVALDLVSAPVAKAKGKGKAAGWGQGANKLDDEEDADEEDGKEDKDEEDKQDEEEDQNDKENARLTKVASYPHRLINLSRSRLLTCPEPAPQPAPSKPTLGTPAPSKQPTPNRSATLCSAFATPRSAKGIGRILHKLSNSGLRAPGLSAKAKIPRLHANLQAAPKARPVVPQAKVRPKKGAKEYDSDEEVPWYEVKPPEEWDSEDGRKYAKVLKRRERGWSSD